MNYCYFFILLVIAVWAFCGFTMLNHPKLFGNLMKIFHTIPFDFGNSLIIEALTTDKPIHIGNYTSVNWKTGTIDLIK